MTSFIGEKTIDSWLQKACDTLPHRSATNTCRRLAVESPQLSLAIEVCGMPAEADQYLQYDLVPLFLSVRVHGAAVLGPNRPFWGARGDAGGVFQVSLSEDSFYGLLLGGNPVSETSPLKLEAIDQMLDLVSCALQRDISVVERFFDVGAKLAEAKGHTAPQSDRFISKVMASISQTWHVTLCPLPMKQLGGGTFFQAAFGSPKICDPRVVACFYRNEPIVRSFHRVGAPDVGAHIQSVLPSRWASIHVSDGACTSTESAFCSVSEEESEEQWAVRFGSMPALWTGGGAPYR